MRPGVVYLVGAGPGDPGLITMKGLECLRSADAVVYDALANPILLREAPEAAERIDVGKRAGGAAMSQEEIQRLLARLARAGKCVVRLKGGDPFVFGRGGEEAEALTQDGIPVEIVPGVTSALAAPAYAGIPVTFRGRASAVAIVTGHEDPGKDVPDVDWETLAQFHGTRVILMGMSRLPAITERLIEAGLDARTPAAVVQWGTRGMQRSVAAPIVDLASEVERAGLGSPAVIVIGDVVELRDRLAWFEKRPLLGRRIVVTRARAQASVLARRLIDLGAEVVEYPVLRVEFEGTGSELDRAVRHLRAFDWVVFTSVNGVAAFFARFDAHYRDVRALGPARFGCIGEATADAVRARGLNVDLCPGRYIAEELAAEFRRRGIPRGTRILLARAELARTVLASILREQGHVVSEITAYRTLRDETGGTQAAAALAEEGFDWVTFTSSSTVRFFLERFGAERLARIRPRARIASIGPITSSTLRQASLPVDAEAAVYTIPGLVDAILAAEAQ